MITDYHRIAGQYKRAKLAPWRTHIECYWADFLARPSVAFIECVK